MTNFAGSSPTQLRFAGGYTEKQLTQRQINVAIQEKNPKVLLDLLSLPQEKSPLYTRTHDYRNEESYDKDEDLFDKVEQAFLSLIQDPKVPRSAIEEIDQLFQKGQPAGYNVPDSIAAAINERLAGNA
jgi:hypothetical protein